MSKLTTVINIKDHPNWEAEGGVYIGRENPRRGLKRSPFCNPYLIGRDGARAEVLQKYREYFKEMVRADKEFFWAIAGLKGKVLACYCPPLPCHGKIIASFLEHDSLFPRLRVKHKRG